MVHPLREEPAMEVHLPPVGRGRAVEPEHQRLRQRARGLDRGRGQRRDQLRDARRGRRRPRDLSLQVAHELLALVAAADRVEACGLEAVRPRAHVVGQDDLRALGVGLVQRAHDAEVLRRLVEHPVGVERLRVEVRQPDATSTWPLHAHERRLKADALTVVEAAVLLPDLLDDAPRVSELDGFPAGRELGRLDRAQPLLCLGPAHVPLHKDFFEPVCLLQVGRSEVASEELHHVQAESRLHPCAGQGHVHRELQGLVGSLQPVGRLPADEILEGRRKSRELTEVDAPLAEPCLQEPLEVGRHPLPERDRGSVLAPGVTVGLEALDVPAVLLHKETVEHVFHNLVPQAAARVLRHGRVERPQGVLEARQALGADVARELRLEGSLHVAPLERLDLEELPGVRSRQKAHGGQRSRNGQLLNGWEQHSLRGWGVC
mmetsp:Transcript_66837/g.189698  ORF Transcript_66837/g.189698 Transcript_66837/m.189698 type:complete len:432 (-) Transcript_66837:38-1333(-)